MIAERISAANDLVSIFDVLGIAETDGPSKIHCPFHSDRRRSARVYPATNSLHCFTESRSWDVVAVVADQNGVGMLEAVEIIEAGAGTRWKERVGPSAEFWRLIKSGLVDDRSVLSYRWELAREGLRVQAHGGVVDWDSFDRAHCDVTSLRVWSEHLLKTMAEAGR